MLTLKSAHRPDGKMPCPNGISHVCARLCLQGGGVAVSGGTVSFSSCSITGNTATIVRAHAQSSHRPDGNIADALAPTHACTTANALVNYRMYVLQRPCKVPIAPMGFSHVLRVCSHGGGVAVWGGTVTFSSCTITGNTASGAVRAHAQNFPSPRWENC